MLFKHSSIFKQVYFETCVRLLMSIIGFESFYRHTKYNVRTKCSKKRGSSEIGKRKEQLNIFFLLLFSLSLLCASCYKLQTVTDWLTQILFDTNAAKLIGRKTTRSNYSGTQVGN